IVHVLGREVQTECVVRDVRFFLFAECLEYSVKDLIVFWGAKRFVVVEDSQKTGVQEDPSKIEIDQHVQVVLVLSDLGESRLGVLGVNFRSHDEGLWRGIDGVSNGENL